MRTSQSTRVSRLLFSPFAFAALVAIATLAAATASATTVTLPAASSIQGIAPFFSDVRVFNTSHDATVAVTATYYCFLGDCPATPPQITIDLAPRDSQAFNDIIADAFGSPNSAGGIEFDFDGDQDLIIVTSRLYSTAPNPTVGMFIPGLDPSQAHLLSALTSVRNRGDGAGFRTNVGVYNPNDTPAVVTFSVLANHAPVGGNVQRVVPAHSGVQVNGIFIEAGASGEDTDNGVVLVQSDVPVFSYAAVIDNNTQDPYLVIGAPDRGPDLTPTQPVNGTPTKTKTPVATRTPRFTVTPNNSASPTPTPNASSSPLLRRVLNESRPPSAPAVQRAGFSWAAVMPEERLLAVLRDPQPPQGAW